MVVENSSQIVRKKLIRTLDSGSCKSYSQVGCYEHLSIGCSTRRIGTNGSGCFPASWLE